MKRLFFIVFLSVCSISACQNLDARKQSATQLKVGSWRGVLSAQNVEIPFIFNVEESGTIVLLNAEERIPLQDFQISGDSITIPMYIFDATIKARILDDKLQGIYVKNYLDDYVLGFEAEYGKDKRFLNVLESERTPFTGKWEVDFMEEQDTTKAIGVFEEFEDGLKGTFVTMTGDYRYLEGVVDGDTMRLSSFDGTHIYLFEAVLDANDNLIGKFWSGKSWRQNWMAVRNPAFELPDPYALTFMKEGFQKFEIKFPNSSGDLVELSDPRYQDKVVVVQILGTWCPNCMDETRFYVDWIEKNPDKDVEFIGLAFERKADSAYAFGRIEQMKDKLEVPYEVLLAGTTNPESRSQALPMLSRIISFPTSIILDKDHKVREIHTGFTGPGTGAYFNNFAERFNLLMEKLLAERANQ
jgi:thiol-disulfide isomerase/thioredoxin